MYMVNYHTQFLRNKLTILSYYSVELSLWTHSVASEYQPDLLNDLPEGNSNNCNNHQTGTNGVTITTTSASTITSEDHETTIEQSDESNLEPALMQKPTINGNNRNSFRVTSL